MLPQRPQSPDGMMRDAAALYGIDQPIDLTDMPEPVDLSNIPDNTQSLEHMLTNPSVATADDDDDFVPESLASFVAEANKNLETTQQDFMNTLEDKKSADEIDDVMSSDPTKPREDDEDRVLKGQVMDRFQQREASTAADFLLSPDILNSPPPNPVGGMTESQIKKAALGFISPQENSFVSPSAGKIEPSSKQSGGHQQGTPAVETTPSTEQENQIWTPHIADHGQTVESKQSEQKKNASESTSFAKEEKAKDSSSVNDLPNQKDLMKLLSNMDTMREEEPQGTAAVEKGPAEDTATSVGSSSTTGVVPTPRTGVSMAATDAAVSMATDDLTEFEPEVNKEEFVGDSCCTKSKDGASPPSGIAPEENILKLGFLGDVVEEMNPSPLSMSSPKAEKPVVVGSQENSSASPTTSVSSSYSARSAKLGAMIAASKEKPVARAPSPAYSLPPAPERKMTPPIEKASTSSDRTDPTQDKATSFTKRLLNIRTSMGSSRFAAARGASPAVSTVKKSLIDAATVEISASNEAKEPGNSMSLPTKVHTKSPTTPSPLSMSSPKVAPTPQSAKKTTMPTMTRQSPPPQFSPPSTFPKNPNVKFTAQSADRLSKPVKKVLLTTQSEKKPVSKPPQQSLTPEPPSSQGKKPLAKFTAETAERLSKPLRAKPGQPSADSPIPQQTPALAPSSSQKKKKTVAKFTAESAERLSKPLSAKSGPLPPESLTPPKTVAKFTVETAERLSKPISNKPILSPPESPLLFSPQKNSGAKFTDETVARLSKQPDWKIVPKYTPATPPRPVSRGPAPQFTAETVERLSKRPDSKEPPEPVPLQNKSPAIFTEETAERLSRPTAAWSSAHDATTLSSPTYAETGTEKISSPVRFTAASAERLCKPTESRSAAIKATTPPRPSPASQCANTKLNATPTQRIVSSAAKALNLSADNDEAFLPVRNGEQSNLSRQSKVVPCDVATAEPAPPESPLDDHMKKTARNPVVRERSQRKKVSGVSSRLLSGTAASTARMCSTDGEHAKRKEWTRDRPPQHRRQPKSLRDEHNLAGKENIKEKGKGSGKRPLTVSKSPKFATRARRPVRPVSRGSASTLAQSAVVFSKGLRDDMSSGSNNSRGAQSLTIPKAPKFATTSRCGERRPPTKERAEVALAQSTDVLRKGLRGSYAAPQLKRPAGPTIPVAPKFHKTTRRKKPKSAADQEKEEMDYFKTHPFKARPLPGNQPLPRCSKRRATMPPRVSQQIPSTKNSTRFADIFSGKSRLLQPTKSQAARMQGKPNLAATHEYHLPEAGPKAKPCKSMYQTPRPFRARPAPLSTHVAPPPVSPSASPTTPNEPFNLATSFRYEKHAAVTEASRRKTEQIAREREAQMSRKLSLREEAIQKKYEADRRLEEAERRRQVAMLEPHSIPPERRLTEPKPFQLSSAARHELSLEQQQKKLAEEEEERRRQAAFKAKPVPKSTYVPPKRIQPKPSDLVDPFSPLLQSKHRAVARKEYDDHAEKERLAAEAQAKAMEEQRAADEEEDMKERRNLPVSEGGLIPTAEPVNSVFWK